MKPRRAQWEELIGIFRVDTQWVWRIHQLGTLQVTVLLVAPPTDNPWSLSVSTPQFLLLHSLREVKENSFWLEDPEGKFHAISSHLSTSVISLLSAHMAPHHSKQASRGILFSKNWPRAAVDFAAPLWDYADGKENHRRTSYHAPFRKAISPPLSKIIACHPSHARCLPPLAQRGLERQVHMWRSPINHFWSTCFSASVQGSQCRCILSFVWSSLYISPFPVSAPNMLFMRWTWSCP